MSTTMSKSYDEPFRLVEVITSVQRRLCWSLAEKVLKCSRILDRPAGGFSGPRLMADGMRRSHS